MEGNSEFHEINPNAIYDHAARAGQDGGMRSPILESTDATDRSARALGINPKDLDTPAYLRNEKTLHRLSLSPLLRWLWKNTPPPDTKV